MLGITVYMDLRVVEGGASTTVMTLFYSLLLFF